MKRPGQWAAPVLQLWKDEGEALFSSSDFLSLESSMPFILLDGNINRLVLTDEQAGEGIVGLLLMQCTDQILSYF